MRRGLILLAKSELPDAVLEARLALVRGAMAKAGSDAVVIYTNNTRPAAVSWLVGFVPYWSEALLVVEREGPPVLVVALTNRVKSWIERTSRVGEVIHTPRIGLEAGRLIARSKRDAQVGIADRDFLPAGIAEDLVAGGPQLLLGDATPWLAKLRAKADPAEIALAAKAGMIAHHALSSVAVAPASLAQAIAEVEGAARRLGAEEAYIAAAPDLDRDTRLKRIEGPVQIGQRFALRATVAYKGSWVRLTRSFARTGGGELAEQAAERFAQAVALLPSSSGFAGASSWLVEGCRLAQPLDPLMGSQMTEATPPGAGGLVSVQACFAIGGKPVLIGAPALVGDSGEAASVLVHSVFPGDS